MRLECLACEDTVVENADILSGGLAAEVDVATIVSGEIVTHTSAVSERVLNTQ